MATPTKAKGPAEMRARINELSRENRELRQVIELMKKQILKLAQRSNQNQMTSSSSVR
jgi:uncharacterized protein YydD (DUF2326 family)